MYGIQSRVSAHVGQNHELCFSSAYPGHYDSVSLHIQTNLYIYCNALRVLHESALLAYANETHLAICLILFLIFGTSVLLTTFT